MTTMAAADRAYRTRCRAVLVAFTAAAVVVGVATATADPTTVGVLVTALYVATVLGMVNVCWWMVLPVGCQGQPAHVNGSAALAVALLGLSTVATVINVITGGPLL